MFDDNKYTRIYHAIVTKASQPRQLQYSEEHHIIPRSLGGSDDPSNLVKLTPKEHYICHALLPKMVSDPKHIRSMYAAFNMMHVDRHGKRYTSILYQYYKIEFYKRHSEMQKGKKRSLESRQKQSASSKGKPWSEKKKATAWVGPTARPVNVYNAKTGEFVARYDSVSSAAKALNCDPTNTWKMCEGKHGSTAPNGRTYPIRSHKGYVFRYA